MTKGNAFCFLGLVVCCALLAGLLVAGAAAQSFSPYQVEGGTISSAGYRLTAATWQVSGTVAGGGYALTSPYAPALRGSGCCCTYLPCLLRSW